MKYSTYRLGSTGAEIYAPNLAPHFNAPHPPPIEWKALIPSYILFVILVALVYSIERRRR